MIEIIDKHISGIKVEAIAGIFPLFPKELKMKFI